MDNTESTGHPKSLVSDETSRQTRDSLDMLKGAIASKPRARRSSIDLTRLAQRVSGSKITDDDAAPPSLATNNDEAQANVFGEDEGVILELAEYEILQSEGEASANEGEEPLVLESPAGHDEMESDGLDQASADNDSIVHETETQAADEVTAHKDQPVQEARTNEAAPMPAEVTAPAPTTPAAASISGEEISAIKALFGDGTVMVRRDDPMEYHQASTKAVNEGYAAPEFYNGELVFRMTSKAANVIRASMAGRLEAMQESLKDFDRRIGSLQTERSGVQTSIDQTNAYLDSLPR